MNFQNVMYHVDTCAWPKTYASLYMYIYMYNIATKNLSWCLYKTESDLKQRKA